ncbi:hypothetical protein LZ31DRAFT_474555 [Colletotrichum somersetense]|nr:hypothetical protein LZ31DRAFT_474555 [Colletotrichum somersetense]
MASRLFFDPMVALRVAPLVSSTCTLLYARDQHFFLGLFNRTAENRMKSAPMLKSYFGDFFRRGVGFVLGVIAISVTTATANLYIQPEALRRTGASWWYALGAAMSAGHLAYVPFVAPRVKALMEAEGEEDVNGILDSWLGVNWWRTVTVDFGAWLAFGVAVATSLHI